MEKNSSLTIIKNIERVVEENPDIHVEFIFRFRIRN